jgi:hypothetical protein
MAGIAPLLPAAVFDPALVAAVFKDSLGNSLVPDAVVMLQHDLDDATLPAKIAAVFNNKDGNPLSPGTELYSVQDVKDYVAACLCDFQAGETIKNVTMDWGTKELTIEVEQSDGSTRDESVSLSNFVVSADLTTAITNALSTSLAGYVTNAELTTALTTALLGYVTTTTLATTLAAYPTTTDVNTLISSALTTYSSSSNLTTAVETVVQTLIAAMMKIESTPNVAASASTGSVPTTMIGGQNKVLGEPTKYFKVVENGVTFLIPAYQQI